MKSHNLKNSQPKLPFPYLVALLVSEEGQMDLGSNYGSSDPSADFLGAPEANLPEMLPPGKIIHISEFQKEVSMCFRDPKEFDQIVVSAKMILDHAPSSYQKMISRAKRRFTTTHIQETTSQQDLNPSV